MDEIIEIYYNKVIKKENPNSFINCFEKEWQNFLSDFNSPYANAKQLKIGNRLRPILCCWGYMHCFDINSIESFDYIAKTAISLEAIHKASVIIDDVIDGDNQRRGEDCYHIEFGEKEATFFSVSLLVSGLKNLNETFNNNTNTTLIKSAVTLLCETIINMCFGAIDEINTTNEDRFDIDRIINIINSETADLLKNSLLLGYLSTNKMDKDIINYLSLIGQKCGYIFQVMNDLEPFCNPKYVMFHKGNLNSDCFRSRKNIVIPYFNLNYSRSNKTDSVH